MKKLILTSGVTVLFLSLLFSGCYKSLHRIEGDYNVVTETRPLPPFSRIINEGIFEVYIIQDSTSQVMIEAESNLIPLVLTNISNSKLVVSTRDNLRPHFPIKVYIHTPNINEVVLSGSGLIHTEYIVTNSFEIGISGSGNIDCLVDATDVNCWISGSGNAFMDVAAHKVKGSISGSGNLEFVGSAYRSDLVISGSGSIFAYEMPVIECFSTISGSGNMYVNVEDFLDVNISGSGSVFYMGNPSLNIRITGSGKVIKP